MIKQLFILLIPAFILLGCRVTDVPSIVDSKPFDLEQNMDKTVKPGDNFFMYSNGTWWDKTSMQGNNFTGFMLDAQKISNQRVANLNSEPIKQFWNKVNNINNTSQAAEELLKRHLKLVENIKTSEQAHNAIIETILAGYDNIFYAGCFMKGGESKLGISFSKNFPLEFTWVRAGLDKLGFTDVSSRVNKAYALYKALEYGQVPLNLSIENIEGYPELVERMVSLNSTKASGSVLLDKILQALKVDFNKVQIDKSMIQFFAKLENAAPESVQCLLQSYIADKYKFTSRIMYDLYKTLIPDTPEFDKAIATFKAKKMRYIYSNAYTNQYVTPEVKSKMQAHCEEIRVAFSDRITQLDWMSETTKQKAKEKLAAMSFNVGYPDSWIESALPKTLNGASMLEDMFTLSSMYDNIAKECVNMPANKAVFHAELSSMDIEEVNAMYVPSVNSTIILPAWMLEPLYDNTKSDAYNYAIFAVIGHEITHGFDNQGAQYNQIGALENWWTVADQMEFGRRQQLLVDCYNLLEILPKELPNTYANGVKTLGENIADLGGAQVAFAAYNAKLLAEGYKDDELVKQHKKFFQAYASLWRNKYTSNFALEMLNTDAHSLSKERINGVVMNIDLWYDLYDVKWGDKLYLKPEKRTYIW